MALIVVPNPGQTLNSSRPDIADNFDKINSAFAIDHVVYNTSGQGKHNKVTFPVQAGAPVIAAGDDALYNLLNATTAINELYIHKQTNAGTSDIPFTASILSQSTPAMGAPGWTMLPSGIIMRWVNFTGTGTTTVTFTPGPIAFTTIYSVILTPHSASAGDQNFAVRLINIISNTQFSVYFSSRTSTGSASGGAYALIIGS